MTVHVPIYICILHSTALAYEKSTACASIYGSVYCIGLYVRRVLHVPIYTAESTALAKIRVLHGPIRRVLFGPIK